MIDSIGAGSTALGEVTTLGRTLKKRVADVLAYFDLPSASNESTHAIHGRLAHLRGTARGSRNLTHFIARLLLATGIQTLPPRS